MSRRYVDYASLTNKAVPPLASLHQPVLKYRLDQFPLLLQNSHFFGWAFKTLCDVAESYFSQHFGHKPFHSSFHQWRCYPWHSLHGPGPLLLLPLAESYLTY